MRKFLLFLLTFSCPAWAQSLSPTFGFPPTTQLRMKTGTTILTPTRAFFNFTGAGVSCADDATTVSSKCTIGAGASGTLQSVYNNGGAGPQTIVYDSTRLGIIFKDNATPVGGTLFGVQTNGGTKLFDVTASTITLGQPTTLSNTSNAINSASGQLIQMKSFSTTGLTAYQFDTNYDYRVDGNVEVYDFRVAGQTNISIYTSSTGATTGRLGFHSVNNGTVRGFLFVDSSNNLNYDTNGGTAAFVPTRINTSLGISGTQWTKGYIQRAFLQGTAITSDKIVLSAGWGSTASVGNIVGSDSAMTFVVTSAGTGQAANPTITITFKDGTWTTVPVCEAKIQATTDAVTALTAATDDAPTATQDVITYNNATGPVATKTYTFSVLCFGT